MANIPVQIKAWNGSAWDYIWPKTTATQVGTDTDHQFVSQSQIDAWNALLSGTGALHLANSPGIDASQNPNFPAADKGDVYIITTAGRIGGVSGPKVEPGDMLICTVDGSASGDAATVGVNWIVLQSNVDLFTGATTSAAGTLGLVPGPAAGQQGYFLRGDGTWSAVPSAPPMTGSNGTIPGASGMVPAPAAADNVKYLMGNGTWQALPTGGLTQPGIVQLTDSTSSTDTSSAATPNSVKTAYDLASTKNRVVVTNGTAPTGALTAGDIWIDTSNT